MFYRYKTKDYPKDLTQFQLNSSKKSPSKSIENSVENLENKNLSKNIQTKKKKTIHMILGCESGGSTGLKKNRRNMRYLLERAVDKILAKV